MLSTVVNNATQIVYQGAKVKLIYKFANYVGDDVSGARTKYVSVIIDAAGNVITAHPGI